MEYYFKGIFYLTIKNLPILPVILFHLITIYPNNYKVLLNKKKIDFKNKLKGLDNNYCNQPNNGS